MEKVGVAQSVCHLMSVCHTNGILRHECHRIFIIYCILVTTMSHQWKSAYNVSPMEICGTNYIPHLGMEKVGVAQSVGHLTSVCHTNGILRHECHRIFIIYCILVYTPFGNGGRGCSVCLSFDIRLSHQWNFAARMSQNFHHILYISDYNVSPMEICVCGKNYIPHLRMEKVRVARSVCCSMSVCHTNGILRHKCHRIFIIYCILVTTMSHQWKSVARMSQNFRHYSIPHMGMEKGRVTPSVLWTM